MAYEYEKENISKIDHFNIVAGSNNVIRPSEELKEVYCKAKAFDEVIELTKTEFVSEDLADSIRILVNDYEFDLEAE